LRQLCTPHVGSGWVEAEQQSGLCRQNQKHKNLNNAKESQNTVHKYHLNNAKKQQKKQKSSENDRGGRRATPEPEWCQPTTKSWIAALFQKEALLCLL